MKRHKTALLSTAISTTTTTTDTAAAPVHDAPLLCLGCERELNGQVYIECAVCPDSVSMCLDCFAEGVEEHSHVKTHKFCVIPSARIPVVASNWGMDEELRLLEGIEKFGFSNWANVASHVGTKSGAMCESHYVCRYLQSSESPLPTSERIDEKSLSKSLTRPKLPYKEHIPDAQSLKMAVNVSVAGQLALRDDYAVEYDEHAESLVKDIVFADHDTHFTLQEEDEKESERRRNIERELKLTLFDMYNRRLDRRARKHIIAQQVTGATVQPTTTTAATIATATAPAAQPSAPPPPPHTAALPYTPKRVAKEIPLPVRSLLRSPYCDPSLRDQILKGYASERELKRKTALLQEWRRMGIQRESEGNEYEQFKSMHNGRFPLRPRPVKLPPVPTNTVTRHRRSDFGDETQTSSPKRTLHPGDDKLTSAERLLCDQSQLLPEQLLALVTALT